MVFLDDSGGNKTLRNWEHWLWGRKIRVLTDHKPLSYLDSSFARHNPRLTRWNIFLQAWDIVTEYRKKGGILALLMHSVVWKWTKIMEYRS